MIKWISSISADDMKELLDMLRSQGDGKQNEINGQVADEVELMLNKHVPRPKANAKVGEKPVLKKEQVPAFFDYFNGQGEVKISISQHWTCPVCENYVDFRFDTPVNTDPELCNFCPECGQKIDWSGMTHDEIVGSIIRSDAEKLMAGGTE